MRFALASRALTAATAALLSWHVMSSSYKRFVVLSGPRTGSTLVQEALDSSPEIICFGEIFNQHLNFIDYRRDGYESTNEAWPLGRKIRTNFL